MGLHPRDYVSIHAPARGATFKLRSEPQPQQVSIHAPARGATAAYLAQAPHVKVSIHAPARGATYRQQYIENTQKRFNPRARAGRDPARTAVASPLDCFNPRARAGRDT